MSQRRQLLFLSQPVPSHYEPRCRLNYLFLLSHASALRCTRIVQTQTRMRWDILAIAILFTLSLTCIPQHVHWPPLSGDMGPASRYIIWRCGERSAYRFCDNTSVPQFIDRGVRSLRANAKCPGRDGEEGGTQGAARRAAKVAKGVSSAWGEESRSHLYCCSFSRGWMFGCLFKGLNSLITLSYIVCNIVSLNCTVWEYRQPIAGSNASISFLNSLSNYSRFFNSAAHGSWEMRHEWYALLANFYSFWWLKLLTIFNFPRGWGLRMMFAYICSGLNKYQCSFDSSLSLNYSKICSPQRLFRVC